MTRRLYQGETYASEFESEVTSVSRFNDKYATVLESTLFYPDSGGQPADTGSIEGLRIEQAIEKDDRILHISDEEPRFGAGDVVKGTIDWQRRFINMQQHTGQHILSQAFIRVLDAATVSSRLGIERSTIDVSRLGLTWEAVGKVESSANSIVFENRPVRIYEARAADVTGLRVKKAVARELLRVVEVEGFDKSPCGGTHCKMTGEVGLVKILRWEKVRDTARVEFVCGRLAEADYFWKSRFIVEFAQEHTTKDRNVPEQIRGLRADHRDLKKQVAHLRNELLSYEAARLEGRAREIRGVRTISAYLDDKGTSEVRAIAQVLTAKANTVALLACREGGVHFMFSRSADVPVDMRKLIEVACRMVDGRGGGRPEACQGGGKSAERASEALKESERLLTLLLSETA